MPTKGAVPLAVGVALFGLASLSGRAAESSPEDAVEELALAAMAASRLPSLSLAYAVGDGKPVARAFGLADVENAVPATARAVFRIGSVSKTLTAVTALRLAELGRLDLDAPIERNCPAFAAKEQPITARQLLGHLGGIRDYDYRRFREEFLSTRRYASLGDALVVFANDPLVAAPGARYQYTSFGYVLLGCAIEGAAGKPYELVVRENVLAPAGMTRTVLDRPESIVAHRSRGYGLEDDGTWSNAVSVDLSDRYPAGGWLSTPSDMARFGQALLAGELLGSETVAGMWQEQTDAEDRPTGYGLGWKLGPDVGEVFHGGSSVGGSAYLYLRPATRTVVAFATNLQLWNEPRHDLARRLADLAGGERGPER